MSGIHSNSSVVYKNRFLVHYSIYSVPLKVFFSIKTSFLLKTHIRGSPILQNSKLVGAVTHVLVNDPTTGYGIFIENMLDAAA